MTFPVNVGRPMDMGVHRMNSLDGRMGSPHGGLHSPPLVIVDKKPIFAGCTFSFPADSRKQDWQYADQKIWSKSQEELRKLAKRQVRSTANGTKFDVTDEIEIDSLPSRLQRKIEDWIFDKNDLDKEPSLYKWVLVTIREKNKVSGLFSSGKNSVDVIIKRTLRSAIKDAAANRERRLSGSSRNVRRMHSADDLLAGGSRRRRSSLDVGRGSRGSFGGGRGFDDLGLGRRDSFGNGGRGFNDLGNGPNMRPPFGGGPNGMDGLNAPRGGGFPPMNGGLNGGMNGGMNPGMGGMNGMNGMNGGMNGGSRFSPGGGVQIIDSDDDSDDFQPIMPNGPRPGGGLGGPMGGMGMGPGPMGGMPNNNMRPPVPPMHNMPPMNGPGMMNNMNNMNGNRGMPNPNMGGMPNMNNMNNRGPMGNMGPMNGMGGMPPRMNPHGGPGMQGGNGMPFAPHAPKLANIQIPMNSGHRDHHGSRKHKGRAVVHNGYSDDDSDVLTSTGSDFSIQTPGTASSLGEEMPHRSGRKYSRDIDRAYRQHGRRRRSSRRMSPDDFVFVESRRPRLGRIATSPFRTKPKAIYDRDHRGSIGRYESERDRLDRIEAEIRDTELRNRARRVDDTLKVLKEREQQAAMDDLDRKMRRLQMKEREERDLDYARSPRSPVGRGFRDDFRERDHLRDFGRRSPIDDDRRTNFSDPYDRVLGRRRDESRYGDIDFDRIPARRY